MGATVLKVTASDPDEGSAGIVSYTINQVCSSICGSLVKRNKMLESFFSRLKDHLKKLKCKKKKKSFLKGSLLRILNLLMFYLEPSLIGKHFCCRDLHRSFKGALENSKPKTPL